LQDEHPEWKEPLHPKYPFTKAEVVFACQNEMAMKVEDVLARRIRVLFMDARASIEMAPIVAELMANELGKDEAWIEKQLKDFNKLANRYLIKS
jgi:glycerol-3-phosphate dehydrogenase